MGQRKGIGRVRRFAKLLFCCRIALVGNRARRLGCARALATRFWSCIVSWAPLFVALRERGASLAWGQPQMGRPSRAGDQGLYLFIYLFSVLGFCFTFIYTLKYSTYIYYKKHISKMLNNYLKMLNKY